LGLDFLHRKALAGQQDSAFLAVVHDLVVSFDKKLSHFLLMVETGVLFILSLFNDGFSFGGPYTVVN
jgi:hypothetical protein